jgi:3-keto-disaccharide hydrolase
MHRHAELCSRLVLGTALCCLCIPLFRAGAAEAEGADGFRPLFDGRTLNGWVNVNCAPETWTVRDGMIHCTGVPTGAMRTEKQYENFILELDWRHLKPAGNAGLFIWAGPISAPGVPFLRAIEVQILDTAYGESASHTTHGDVFPIHGSTMEPDPPSHGSRSFPKEKRSKPSPEWNHYRVTCRDGVLKLAVNGKEVSGGSHCNYRKGYIALESEGGTVDYRNIRIKELPSSRPPSEETAPLTEGFHSLYTGVDLNGWKVPAGSEGHWKAADWRLSYDGKSTAEDKNLWTEKSYRDFVLICDWRWTDKPVKKSVPVILPSGDYALEANGQPKTVEVLDAGDSGVYLRGSSKSQVNIWNWPVGSGEVYGYRTDKTMPVEVRAAVTPNVKADRPIGQWNRFIITMKGDRLTVELNGTRVLENARLPGVPREGPIALQHHGDPIQFASIYIKEL